VATVIRLRARDLAQAVLRVVDWTLAEPGTEILITVATLGSAVCFSLTQVRRLMSNFENVLATGLLTATPRSGFASSRRAPACRRRRS
jgi:hypothetical protein